MYEAKKILAKALLHPEKDIPTDAHLETFDKWDSLGHMRLILEIENILDRDLTTVEVVSIRSVKDIENLISN
tara:strand:- start:205 stop:420 length:216 start_codon:yes stop_codon:yes gene_type:complete